MKKLYFLSLFISVSAFAFGGGGGSSGGQRYDTGVSSFGTHFGGNGNADVSFGCGDCAEPDETQGGVCVAKEEGKIYNPLTGKCVDDLCYNIPKTTCYLGCAMDLTTETAVPEYAANGLKCTTNNKQGACYEGGCDECAVQIENCATLGDNCTCTTCKAGFVLSEDKTECACPSGTSLQANGHCCPDGYRLSIDSNNIGTCIACPAGTFQPAANQTACVSCPPGTVSTGGVSICTPCQPGTFQDKAGQAKCEKCLAGYTSSAGASSCTCIHNYVSDDQICCNGAWQGKPPNGCKYVCGVTVKQYSKDASNPGGCCRWACDDACWCYKNP